MAFPTYTKTFHNFSYPSISPTRPELSTAGKVILITGGGSGIGPRITHAFAVSGSTRIAVVGRTASSLLSIKTDVEAEHPGVKVLTFVADIIDRAAVFAALEGTKKAFGPVDVLVSNAGYFPNPAPLAESDVDEWFKGLEVNVKGNLNLIQAFLANCAEKPTYIYLSTGGAHAPPLPFGVSGYGVSKLAATRLMEYFMFENPHVRVMNVHPGVIDTAMNNKAEKAGLVIPRDDVELSASFIVWAASPEAEFLKGKLVWSNWDVDELKAKKAEIEGTLELTIGLIGWA